MAAVATQIPGVPIIVGEVVLVDDPVGDAVQVQVGPENRMVGVDAGVNDHRAVALAAEGREAGIGEELIQIDQCGGGRIGTGGSGRGQGRLSGSDRGEQVCAGGGVVIDDRDRGHTLVTDHGAGGCVGELDVEELAVLRLAVIANADGLWIGEQYILHRQELAGFVGGKMNGDRCKVEVVAYRCGGTATAGGRAIPEAKGGADL